MCGRVTLTIDFETLKSILKTKYNVPKPHINPYNPRYNITPGQNLVTVLHDGQGYRAGELSWGFVPPWSKDTKSGYKMINARAESLREKTSFKPSFEKKRCVILADSYYEWRTTRGDKVPFRVQMKDQPLFPIAGLYTSCTLPDGNKHHSCTVITTEANEIIRPIHHRMPVVLTEDEMERWLEPTDDLMMLESLLKPYEPTQMTLYEVTKLVNNSRIDAPECIEPADRDNENND